MDTLSLPFVAGRVFFFSIPLACMMHLLCLGSKHGLSFAQRALFFALAAAALAFTFWLGSKNGITISETYWEFVWQHAILFLLLLPTAYFVDKAYRLIWTFSDQKSIKSRNTAKAIATFIVSEAIGVAIYYAWWHCFS